MSTPHALDQLRTELDGDIFLPGDDGYAGAAQPWSMQPQSPAAVTVPANAEDLRRIVIAARTAGLHVHAQTSGHGATGTIGDDVVIVRMSAFRSVSVDAEAATAVVGAGAVWGDVLAALDPLTTPDRLLIPPMGTSATVSVAGLLLSGGLGWTSRLGGLASQALRRVQVLTTDGALRWIDDADDADAMWAMRGAGGVLGVVTALELDLRAATRLIGGVLTWDIEHAEPVLRAVRDAILPDGATVFVDLMSMPDLPFLPDVIRGRSWVAVDVVLIDTDADALDSIRAAAPVRAEDLRPLLPSGIPSVTNDPTEPAAGGGCSRALDDMSDEAISRLVAFRTGAVSAPMIGVQLRRLGGQVPTQSRPAVAAVDADWCMHGLIPHFPGTDQAAVDAALTALADVWPEPDRALPPSFLEPGDSYGRAFTADALDRLVAVRDRLDPTGTMLPLRMP